MPADEGGDGVCADFVVFVAFVLLAEVGDEQLQGFGAETLVPKGFGYPIAYGGFALAGREVAVARGSVAYGTDEQVVFLADDCPCGGVAEDGLDDVQALLHRLVGCPARPRSYIWIGGVSVQERRIVVLPRTEEETIVFYTRRHRGIYDLGFDELGHTW